MSGHDEYHHDEHDHHHHHHHHEDHHQGDDHLISSTNSEAAAVGEGHHDQTDESHDFVQPSAPTIENGYIVVPPTPQSSVDASQSSSDNAKQDALVDELTKVINDVNAGFKEIQQQVTNTVFAEADSSNEPAAKPKPTESGDKKKKPEATEGCSLCPYYLLACDRLSKMEVPPKVKDLLLWKDVKLTGAVFGSSLVLLISLAAFSLLTVVSTLFLTALVALGAYRFYLGLIFRIKGNYDNTFDKLSSQDLSLPKDKIKQLVHLLENDVNRTLNALKSIVLWDNLTTSLIAFSGFYIMYCVGSMFNTITLLILGLLSAFTLPKVYTVYKVQIDQAIEKTTAAVHQVVKQVLVKIPMLNKKKTQ